MPTRFMLLYGMDDGSLAEEDDQTKTDSANEGAEGNQYERGDICDRDLDPQERGTPDEANEPEEAEVFSFHLPVFLRTGDIRGKNEPCGGRRKRA